MKYTHEAGSPSDRAQWLGFDSESKARAHVDAMNNLLETFPDKSWNLDYWKSKPSKWEFRLKVK